MGEINENFLKGYFQESAKVIASVSNEIDVIKNAFRNELARHEVKMIKKGHDVSSIID